LDLRDQRGQLDQLGLLVLMVLHRLFMNIKQMTIKHQVRQQAVMYFGITQRKFQQRNWCLVI
jgi:hypothetical protein